jgi:uncharacterized membrane protein YidH (DUF202 family)
MYAMTHRKFLTGLCLLAAVQALAALVFLLLLPADPKNAVLWGFSAARLALAVGLLTAALALFAAGVLIWCRPERAADSQRWLAESKPRLWIFGSFLVVVTLAAWVLICLPPYRFGHQASLMERLSPLVVWLGLVSFQTLLALLVWQKVLDPRRTWAAFKAQGRLWWLVLAGAGLLLLMWAAAFPLGLLAEQDAQQYNPPGVPLLGLQALFGGLAGIVVLILSRRSPADDGRTWRRLDWAVLGLIWATAAWLWLRTPALSTFFAPGPYPPDWTVFPLSDAALYDRTAQFALLGLGLNNGRYVDKPLYSSFLTLLHLLAGQDYSLLTALQTVVLAWLPAMVYAIGRRLHSRAVGVTAALLVTLRGVNAIAGGHWIQTAHSRLLLSELPTALTLVLLTFWLVRWFQKPRDLLYPLLAGGTLGLATLVRHNPWLLLPVIAAAALVLHWPHWKRWLVQTALLGLMLTAVISPWMMYSQKTVGTPWYFMIPLRGTVWKNRYLPELESSGFAPADSTARTGFAVGAAIAGSPLLGNSWRTLPQAEKPASRYADVARFIGVHFVNNVKSTLLILPDSVVYDDLDHTLSAPDSVWQRNWWDGRVSAMLAVNVLLVVLGVGVAWRKWRLAGLAPLMVYLGYLLALTAARTSGGRYIVPVDWVVMLYFATGLVQLAAWLLGLDAPPAVALPDTAPRAGKWRLAAAAAGLMLVVGIIPLAQEALPLDLPPAGMAALPSEAWLLQNGIQPQTMAGFLDQEGAVLQTGRVVYPRFYRKDEGDHNECFITKPYPRLVFELLNEEGFHCVVLPLEESPRDVTLHASQVLVLGCENSSAWAVLLPDLDLALLRSPRVNNAACPLPDPLCDDNRNCH